MFPLMSEAELLKLGKDIKKNGLRSPIVLYDEGQDINPANYSLLDGRNRLDALELVGVPFKLVIEGRNPNKKWNLIGPFLRVVHPPIRIQRDDPYDYVISANIHRRHLTAEDKRKVIADVIKAKSELSNRRIAEMANADHKTVGAVRDNLEATGEIPQLKKTTGKDGKARKRPTSKRDIKRQRNPTLYGDLYELEDMIAVEKKHNEGSPPAAEPAPKPNRWLKTKAAQQRAVKWTNAAKAAVEALTELEELRSEYRGDCIEARALFFGHALDVAKRAVELGSLLVDEASPSPAPPPTDERRASEAAAPGAAS
jgi:hypothetical protein